MADRSRFPRPRQFTLDEQIFHMSAQWPQFQLVRRRRQVVAAWRGSIQPTPLSDIYVVCLRFRPGWCPQVRVLAPELKPREGVDGLPHIYPDGSLCLNQSGEWHRGMLVATFIPWASSWLYFYEIWHAIGLWLGGGTHPDRPEHKSG
jgi:hypothetical protein